MQFVAHAGVTIDGTCKVGANFAVVALHPMNYGATLMSSFLFNVALVRPCAASFAAARKMTAVRRLYSQASSPQCRLFGVSSIGRLR